MSNVHKKILASEAVLMARQSNEMNALRKKLERCMNERLTRRELEHIGLSWEKAEAFNNAANGWTETAWQ